MICDFCKKELKKGTGKMFVFNSGKITFFCSSKCEKYFFMNRSVKYWKWNKHESRSKVTR